MPYVVTNEAFDAQSLAVLHEWGMDLEDERLNPNGEAMAIGTLWVALEPRC